MMNLPPPERPQFAVWGQNGHPRPIHVTLDLYRRLCIALTTDPRYHRDEVVRLLRDDELLVDTLSKNLSRKETGEVVGTFEVIEEDNEVEYVELIDDAPRPAADDFE